MRSWSDLRPGCRPWVVAHRGDAAHAPENTLAAFDAAVEAEADAIELDVQLTSDRVAVVLHDDTLDRTTDGCGRLRERTAEQVRGLDAGSWHGSAFAGEHVPTLEEVLRRYGERMPLDLELKGASPAVAAACVRLLDDAPRNREVLVSSFSAALLDACRQASPDTPRLLLGGPDEDVAWLVDTARALRVRAVGIDAALAATTALEALRAAGLPVLVFTVDDEPTMRALLARGAEGIFSNDARRLRRVVGDVP